MAYRNPSYLTPNPDNPQTRNDCIQICYLLSGYPRACSSKELALTLLDNYERTRCWVEYEPPTALVPGRVKQDLKLVASAVAPRGDVRFNLSGVSASPTGQAAVSMVSSKTIPCALCFVSP
jgi:hypothetical protein